MSTKATVAIGAIVALVLGVAVILLLNSDERVADQASTTPDTQAETESSNQQTNDASQSQESISEHLEGANIGKTVDATDQERVEISITDYMYEITELTISEGTTVVWVNDGNGAHDVTSDTESTDLGSELLENGETYEYTFNEGGEYLYHCSPHPFRMRAAVTVVE